MADPHKLLGVSETASLEEVRRRYKKVSKMFHPDKCDNDRSAVFVFQMVSSAYKTLKEVRNRIELPLTEDSKTKEEETHPPPSTLSNVIVPGTNITENDIRVLGEKIQDPWFNPSFDLTEFFGDVAIPDKGEKSGSKSTETSMRPRSTRR